MKGNYLIIITLLILCCTSFSCSHTHNTPISNRLTSFVDPAVIKTAPTFYKISNPTGNALRDAIRVLEKDSRTKGKFQSVSLQVRTIEQDLATFQFLGKSNEISDFTNAPISQQITIQIEDNQDGPFYQLSIGSNP